MASTRPRRELPDAKPAVLHVRRFSDAASLGYEHREQRNRKWHRILERARAGLRIPRSDARQKSGLAIRWRARRQGHRLFRQQRESTLRDTLGKLAKDRVDLMLADLEKAIQERETAAALVE